MALTKAFHWQQEDYFPFLLKNNVKTSVLALEYLGRFFSLFSIFGIFKFNIKYQSFVKINNISIYWKLFTQDVKSQ